MTNAVAYYRTSSNTASGVDSDSLNRQKRAVIAYAKLNKIKIVKQYYDKAVSGADTIENRNGFTALLSEMQENGAAIILVENATRFARDLMVQMTGHARLKQLGFDLIAVDSPAAFTDDTPTAVLMRQIMGAFAEFDKATLVARLKSGKEAKRRLTGKCGGRKSMSERHPELTEKVRHLRRKRYRHKPLSYDRVARELFEQGYSTKNGKQLSAAAVKRLIQ